MARNKPPIAAELPASKPSATSQPAAASLGLDDAELSERAHGDDAPPLANSPLVQPRQSKHGDDGRPYCNRHNCLMVASSTHEHATYYRCPVPDCKATGKRARPQHRVPAAPLLCQQRTCHADHVALEVLPKYSTGAQLHMSCPRCAFALKVPRPQFGPELERQRRQAAVDDLGAR